MHRLTMTALLALALTGCITMTNSMGTPLDESRVAGIQKCTTTRAELVSWFGEPSQTGITDGFTTLQWQYASATGGIGTSSMTSQLLWIAVNGEQQVIGYAYNPTAPLGGLKDECAAEAAAPEAEAQAGAAVPTEVAAEPAATGAE